MRKFLFLILVLCLAISCTKSNNPNGKKKFTIAVIPKGTTHEFWKSIHAGSIKAANELTAQGTLVEVIWKGPIREDDREQQIQVVEGFAAQGVSGIVLAPLDNRA
jgi:ribose transport system substrate-binding protein